MELSEFIKEALSQAIMGVEMAQENIFKKYGAYLVDPAHGQHEDSVPGPHYVEITATVTAVESSSGKASLNVVSLLSGGITEEESVSKASSVKIRIPVIYPKYGHTIT